MKTSPETFSSPAGLPMQHRSLYPMTLVVVARHAGVGVAAAGCTTVASSAFPSAQQ